MNLMKYRYLYFIISLIVIIPGLISLVRNGLQLGIDFSGGSLLEVSFAQTAPNQEQITETVAELYSVQSIQNVSDTQVIIRGGTITNEVKDLVITSLSNQYGPVREEQFATVGPALSKELLQKTLNAILIVATFITLYVSRQFKNWKFGVSAIIAMLHDSLVLLGIFSILGYFYNVEVDVLFVTALLTTLSFSVHDTIVVYDRIRELKRKHPLSSLYTVVGAAVLETLGRSINNSVTIIIMLLSLVLLGGQTIHTFALALLIGAITGTYSSTFTAAPLLLLLDDLSRKYSKKSNFKP